MKFLKSIKQMKYCFTLVGFLFISNIQAADLIKSLTTTETIGYTQSPTVYIEIEIDKTRDLHVAFQNMNGWRTIERTMKRIKKSGKYHFEVPIDDLKPGRYRIDAYLAPKGRNWDDRLTQTKHAEFEVIKEPVYVVKTNFSKQDNVKFVGWPKQIVGNQDATLAVKYEITEPRELHIKLLNSENWKEHGSLKFPVSEPGNFTLPLSHLSDDFPEGKYAWVIYLTAKGETKELGKKYGKHFILTSSETK